MRRTVLALLALLAALLAAAPARAGVQASFDCAAAKGAIEAAICADPALAEADRTLAALYADAQISAWGAGPSNQLAAQREWLKSRDGCAGDRGKLEETIGQCLLAAYKVRNSALAVATLFVNPGRSFAVLRADDPDMAPLYEAIYHYTIGLPGDRPRVLALVRPYWDKLHREDYAGYGASILDDSIKTPDRIIASDANFGQFLYVASAYAEAGADGVIDHRFPCAAIVRRPGLLSAVSAVFGSTLDNFGLRDDCDATLPPQPRLSALLLQTSSIDPACEEGTIRFALYRDAAVTRTSAALGLPLPKDLFRGTPGLTDAKLAAAAEAELADQYQRWAKMPAAKAAARAHDWVRALLVYQATCGE